MTTSDERRAMRKACAGTFTVLRWVLPMLGGAAWTAAMLSLTSSLDDVLPLARGTRTLDSLFMHPLLFLLSATLPYEIGHAVWKSGVLLRYYAVLTAIVWNAPRGPRRFWLAAALYGLHLGLSFVGTCCTAYVYAWSAVPPTWGDWRMLLELGREAPGKLMAFGALLLAWHMVAWWRIWLGLGRVKGEK